MPTITSIIQKAKVTYVNFDDGTQQEYPGDIAAVKADIEAKAAMVREQYAAVIAMADGLKTEADLTKSPAIGKETKLDSSVKAEAAVEGVQ
jgi:phage baseplate assembly protein gpV